VDLNIVLVGDNTIEDTGGTGIDNYAWGYEADIHISGDGTGTLTITETAQYDGYGVYLLGALTIENVTMYINSSCAGLHVGSALTVKDSKIILINSGTSYCGIVVDTGNILIDGSVLIGNLQPIMAYAEQYALGTVRPFLLLHDNSYNYTLANDGMIITYDPAASPFTDGTSVGIVSDPVDVAVWAIVGGAGGISYNNNGLTGFIAIPGVTVATSTTTSICEIVETTIQYSDLADALTAVHDNQTIKLLKKIDYNGGIFIDGISVTFELDGYDLNVTNASGYGLEVINNGEVLLDNTAGGALNVTSTSTGGMKIVSGNATVTIVTGTGAGTGHYGVNAQGATTVVTVVGDVSGGVFVEFAATVTVNGNVMGVGIAVGSYDSSIVTVGGDVTGGTYGIVAGYDATVIVEGNVTNNTLGIYVDQSTATLKGNISTSGSITVSSSGVFAFQDASLLIAGGVELTGVNSI
jgi:hypothetical protein